MKFQVALIPFLLSPLWLNPGTVAFLTLPFSAIFRDQQTSVELNPAQCVVPYVGN
eukprot:bmy_16400T0